MNDKILRPKSVWRKNEKVFETFGAKKTFNRET